MATYVPSGLIHQTNMSTAMINSQWSSLTMPVLLKNRSSLSPLTVLMISHLWVQGFMHRQRKERRTQLMTPIKQLRELMKHQIMTTQVRNLLSIPTVKMEQRMGQYQPTRTAIHGHTHHNPWQVQINSSSQLKMKRRTRWNRKLIWTSIISIQRRASMPISSSFMIVNTKNFLEISQFKIRMGLQTWPLRRKEQNSVDWFWKTLSREHRIVVQIPLQFRGNMYLLQHRQMAI